MLVTSVDGSETAQRFVAMVTAKELITWWRGRKQGDGGEKR